MSDARSPRDIWHDFDAWDSPWRRLRHIFLTSDEIKAINQWRVDLYMAESARVEERRQEFHRGRQAAPVDGGKRPWRDGG
jgi:hypothetical protein